MHRRRTGALVNVNDRAMAPGRLDYETFGRIDGTGVAVIPQDGGLLTAPKFTARVCSLGSSLSPPFARSTWKDLTRPPRPAGAPGSPRSFKTHR